MKKKVKVKVVIVRVGKAPQVEEIDDTLKAFQRIVGGLIESVPNGYGVVLFCNEDGRFLNLPFNRQCLGDFFFSQADKHGKSISLSDSEIEILCKAYSLPSE